MKFAIAQAYPFRIRRSGLIEQQFRLDFEFGNVFDFLSCNRTWTQGSFLRTRDKYCYKSSTMLYM